jgi:hypothetical protein
MNENASDKRSRPFVLQQVVVWILFPHDRNLANGDTQSFRDKSNGVYLANIEVWGNVDRARRRNMRIDNLENEAPNEDTEAGSSLDSCERICERSRSFLFADGEHCPLHEQETPGLSRSSYLDLRLLFAFHVVKAWYAYASRPDLQLVFRDSRELALQLSEDPPFKRRSLFAGVIGTENAL